MKQKNDAVVSLLGELLELLRQDIFTDAPECSTTVNRIREIVTELNPAA